MGRTVYAYANGNPISNVDPLGLIDWHSLPQGFVNASAGVDACSESYQGGQLAGFIGAFATGEGEVNLAFKTEHYAERLIAAGVDVKAVEAAVAGSMLQWIGGSFDPTALNISDLNERLCSIKL